MFVDYQGKPHVAWEQALGNGQDATGNKCAQNDIYYTHSVDSGETFLPVTAEIDRILTTQFRVSSTVDGNRNPAVAWVDTRQGKSYIYFSRSYDGGKTFTQGVRIDTSSKHQDRPCLIFDSYGNPVIAWIKKYHNGPNLDPGSINMNPVGHIYVTKSTDGGLTFEPSVCVHCDSFPAQGWPSMVMDSHNNPMVVAHYYRRDKKRWVVAFIKSVDQGDTFQWPVLIEDTSFDQIVAGHRVIAVDSDDNPYITIMDKRNGYWNAYLAKSTDGGASFLPSIAIDSSPADQDTPSIAIDSADNQYITWADKRNGYSNIYFTASEDGGATFRESFPIDPNPVLQNRPCMGVDFSNDIPHITWTDRRQGLTYIYHTKSVDNGVTFSPSVPVYEFPSVP